jgi:hypothetical protein
MIKNIKEALLITESLLQKRHYLKAKAILDPHISEINKLETDQIVKLSTIYSKIVNRISCTKPDLKRSEVLLTKSYSLLQSINKKASQSFIYQLFLTSLNLSSIYSKQNKPQLCLSYLKRLCEVNLPKRRRPKLIFLQSKVFLSLSTTYQDLNQFQESLNFGKLSLESIKEVIFSSFSISSISSLTSQPKEKLLHQKEKLLVLILSNLNIASSLSNIFGRRAASDYFDQALAFAELLDESHLIFLVQQKILEFSQYSKGTHDPNDGLSRDGFKKKSSSCFFGGIYYSTERLRKVSRWMDLEPKFICTDDFFSRKIRNELGVGESHDKHVCEKTTEIKEIEKKAISFFRKKKHQRTQSVDDKVPDFDRRLDFIQKETDENILKQSVKIQSKLRSQFNKNLIKNISLKQKNLSLPSQRLFFKPPIENSSASKRSSIKKNSSVVLDAKSSSKLKEIAKNEIENLLIKINEDMKDKEKDQDKTISESKLALSAQKGLTVMKETREALRKTLSNVILGKRRIHQPKPTTSNSLFKVTFK